MKMFASFSETKLLRCLVIEQDHLTALTVSRQLASVVGIGVIETAPTAEDALAKVMSGPVPDMLIIGLTENDFNGLELARLLRDQIEFIVFFGDEKRFALMVFEAGGDLFVYQVTNNQAFCKGIRNLITKWSPHLTISNCTVEDNSILKIPLIAQPPHALTR